MKIYKFSVSLAFITLVALLYVHQQVQLLKLSYQLELNEKHLTTLVDQNRTLVYNITRLKSPVYLQEKFLVSQKDYRIPQRWQVVEAAATAVGRKQTVVLAKTTGAQNKIVAALKEFFVPQEALAKTVK